MTATGAPSSGLRPAVLLFAGLAIGCTAPERDSDPPPPETPTGSAPVESSVGRVYERQIAFLELEPEDDALAVGWWFRTETNRDSPRREAWGWLGRGDNWDAFFRDAWITSPDEAPWRLHPRDPMRLEIGAGDDLENVVYRSEGRYLELRIGTPVVSWREARGGTIRLSEALVTLQDKETPGLVFDLQRARGLESEDGPDWTEWFLLVGDDLRVALVADEPSTWQAWILDDAGDRPLPLLASQWTGRRVLDDARREVPTGWVLTGTRGEVEVTLEVDGSYLEPLEGPGPVFGVDGLQVVSGVWVMGADTIEVHGLQRLSQR